MENKRYGRRYNNEIGMRGNDFFDNKKVFVSPDVRKPNISC